MRVSRTLTLALLAGVGLAGCAAASDPTPTPTGSGLPTPTATGSATPRASNLPTVEAMLAALDTAGEDDRVPTIRLGVALTADQPQFLEDSRATPFGQGAVRVVCSNEDGGDVTVAVTIGAADPVTFLAPCFASPSSVTSQEQVFDFTSTYRFTVTSTTDATVAIGVVPSVPQ